MERNKVEGFTPPEGGYGWVIILATTLINISVHPLVYGFFVIFQPEFGNLAESGHKTGLLMNLQFGICCASGVLAIPLLKKYDFRKVSLLGTCLMCLGIFLSGFGKSYQALVCTYSILAGVGHGIIQSATYLAVNTYFKKRLMLAISLSQTSASITYIFMVQLCAKLLEQLKSTQTTVIVLGAISLLAVVCCFLLKPKGNDVEQILTQELDLLNTDGHVQKTTTPVKTKSLWKMTYELFNLELLKDRPYMIAIGGIPVSFASELTFGFMMTLFLLELAALKIEDLNLVLMVQSIADIIGRLTLPLAGYYFKAPPRLMYAGCLTLSTVVRILMAMFYSSKTIIILCVCLIGWTKGAEEVYHLAIIPKYVSFFSLFCLFSTNYFKI